MKGLKKSINGKEILKETWLSFSPGAKIGIIGHNGAGKSTLMKIIAGTDQDYEGEAFVANGIKVGYLPQEPQLNPNKNVFENIMDGLAEKQNLIDKFNRISAKFSEKITTEQMNILLNQQLDLQEKIDACDGWSIEREVDIAMEALRCPSKEADISKISGGEKRRVALCKLLLEKPDMILLDEPTNHLDAQSVSWLENYLKNYKGTVIAITHDRYFLDKVAEWILEVNHGKCTPWHSNYSNWLEKKQKELEAQEKEESSHRKQLKNELEWITQPPKARQSKSKARINAYQELVYKKRDVKDINENIQQIVIPNGPRLGNLVIEACKVCKSFSSKLLLKDVSFRAPPGAIVGIIGPNGAGKSTLFNILTGCIKPDSGTVNIGDTVRLGYVNQSRDDLNENNTVWEEISDNLEEIDLGHIKIKSRAYCSTFNFKGSKQQQKISTLSGGERNRVHLAKLLKKGANVILLDEPSNDLDVDTLRSLEEAILNFAGCVFVISHDRWFLDRISTHIISYDEDGGINWFEGNYEDYHNNMIKILGKEAKNPKYKHKKLF